MKAIETRYKGYRFRSRLEARWAVYFDALDVAWEYEPEGFVLPSGPYLPDFFLPRWKVWAEVKPIAEAFDWNKALELAEYTAHPVVALVGAPEDKWLQIAVPRIPCYDTNGKCVDVIDQAHDWWDIGTTIDDGRFWVSGMPHYPTIGKLRSPCSIQAAEKARSARFEHGERP